MCWHADCARNVRPITILRTDALKILKNWPPSSSKSFSRPQIFTGPRTSSIAGTLLGSPFPYRNFDNLLLFLADISFCQCNNHVRVKVQPDLDLKRAYKRKAMSRGDGQQSWEKGSSRAFSRKEKNARTVGLMTKGTLK